MTAMTDIIPQLSLPPCILCSSITGNTRSLADALAGATKGVYHKNNASRKVSRLAKAVNAME